MILSRPSDRSLKITPGTPATFENLEPRRLLSVSTDSIVRFDTTLGRVDVQLFTDLTPRTVTNFLQYVNSGRYNNTLIHRSVPGFVVQGGGFNANTLEHIPEFAPVVNEFIPSNSNTRGKIAMAKKGGDPNSATSEFFFNLADNSQNLDNQNGGFTSFGIVLGNGMDIIDRIASVPVEDRTDLGSAFGEIPLVNGDTPVVVNSVSQLKTIVLGDTTERNLIFTASNGAQQIISLAGNGPATIDVLGRDLKVTSDGATYVLTGSNIRIDRVDGNQMTHGSALAITTADPAKPITNSIELSTSQRLRAIQFRDADGTLGVMRLNGPGTLDGTFSGNNLRLVVNGVTGILSGANVRVDDLRLTGTNAASVLAINAAGGDGRAIVGNISSDGAMGAIIAPRVTVDSAVLSIGGTLRQMRLDRLQDTRVEVRGTAGPGLLFNVRNVINSDLFSDLAPVNALICDNWITNDEAIHGVIAPMIGRINARGDFAASLYLNDPGTGTADTPTVTRLNNVRILGTADGTWSIDGSARLLTIAGFTSDFDATLSGSIQRIKSSILRGNITAATINSIDSFAMSEATLSLTAPYAPGTLGLRHMRLRNAMFQSMIRSQADVGFLNVAGVYHSFIFAGLADSYTDPIQAQLKTDRANRQLLTPIPSDGIDAPLPTSADFTTPAMLRNLNLRGFRGREEAFVNSNIGATVINRAGLRLTRLSQATETEPTPFFIVGRHIGLLGLYGAESRRSIVLNNINSQLELEQSLARQNVVTGDLKIRIADAPLS